MPSIKDLKRGDLIEIGQKSYDGKMDFRRVRIKAIKSDSSNCHIITGVNARGTYPVHYALPSLPSAPAFVGLQPGCSGWIPFTNTQGEE